MSMTPGTYPSEPQFGGRPVTFRPLRAEDKELFKSFIRSLPRKDNYYLRVDVLSDQAIERWANRVASGQTISMIALDGGQMIGYCNLHTNDLPWARHVGEIRMSVSAAHRGRGVGRALASEAFAIAQARGVQKLWARMAVSQEAAHNVFTSLGFRTEGLLSGFVTNEDGLTEDLVIMSHDAEEPWEVSCARLDGHKEAVLPAAGLRRTFERHLRQTLAKDRYSATDRDRYYALALAVRDQLVDRWVATQQTHHKENVKRVYYLSLEFLMGRLMGN